MMLHMVSQYLRRSAALYPEHTALVDIKRSVDYKTFLFESECIAGTLADRGLFKKPVAVFMEKGIQAIMAFLGTAISGNFYTVIDVKMPGSRIDKILDTFRPEVILTDRQSLKKAEEVVGISGRPLLIYEDMVSTGMDDSRMNRIQKAEQRIIDKDILYVLFTSGSTGIPKGVIISHRSVLDYTEWVAETFELDHGSVLGNQSPFYFDNSVLDIYSTIRNGATLHIIPQVCFAFPIRLLEYVRDYRINTVFWVPTVLSRVADMELLDKCDIKCLKKVLFAGEVMPARQLNAWIRRLPEALFANLYGPTEITVDCTYYIVNREIADAEPVPIGYPCINTDILILNGKNELVDIGEKGEICVRGTSLAMGYYNSPEKTDAAFVQNPLNSAYRELIYRTGDIAHYNDRGEIIFDGRTDSQVKHTGHRIELGEIETAVSAINGITMNCCLHKPETDQLVLFYTGEMESGQIRKVLAGTVPEYMLPNVCIRLSQMPLNLNGKIDRLKLRENMSVLTE